MTFGNKPIILAPVTGGSIPFDGDMWSVLCNWISKFPANTLPGTLDVIDGNVCLFTMSSEGVWCKICDLEAGRYMIETSNSPTTLVKADANAKFRWTWA